MSRDVTATAVYESVHLPEGTAISVTPDGVFVFLAGAWRRHPDPEAWREWPQGMHLSPDMMRLFRKVIPLRGDA